MFIGVMLFIVSCKADKHTLEQAGESAEYKEYKHLIDENQSNITSNKLEQIKTEDWRQYQSLDQLADAGILSKESATYKHYKNYERIAELNDILYNKYGLKGFEISKKINRFKDKSYYQDLYKNQKNESH